MEEIIKEIAELMDIQEVVFLHKETHEILAYPIADGLTDEEFDYIEQEVMEVINIAPDNYIRFDPLNSRQSFQMMEDFIETIKNERLRARLIDAISIRKPFEIFEMELKTKGFWMTGTRIRMLIYKCMYETGYDF